MLLTVVVAPDSFKGTVDAASAAEHIAKGWMSIRPHDRLVLRPQADGGEGTLDAIASAIADAQWMDTGYVTGPDGAPVPGRYLLLPDGTACVELALTSGLPLMRTPDTLGATTRGTGEVIARALADGATGILLGLGGSASTDGGAGSLSALGLRLLDAEGHVVSDGGRGLLALSTVDRGDLAEPPPNGMRLLCDVTAPLLGPSGAAATFGPQKGASPAQVEILETALARFADATGAPLAMRELPGGGAAGGTAFGFVALWGASIESGAETIARLTGLEDEVSHADILITGEGRFDATSLTGKVVGNALATAAREGVAAIVITGSAASAPDGVPVLALADLAGSEHAAMTNAGRWLEAAGAEAARQAPERPVNSSIDE